MTSERLRASVLAVILALGLAAPAASQRPPADPAEGSLAQLRAEHRDEMLRARRMRADAEEAAAELARLDRELRRLDTLEARDAGVVQAQRARLEELNAREARILERLASERARHGRLLSALQMLERRPPPPLLVPADRAVDTVRAAILMKALAPELRERAGRLAGEQAEVNRVRRRAALASEALFTAESANLDRRAEMENLRTRRQTLLSALRADAVRAERAARALEARIEALGGQVEPVRGETAGAARTAPSPTTAERMVSPVPGAPEKRYGEDVRGWTWRTDGGQTVVAPADAVVDHADYLDGWGGVVILSLRPGWRVVLAGLDSFTVRPGDQVAAGAPLGRAPGAADSELRFELRRDGRPVDPAPWME